jgi:4'-phosphopantetheinyl transferase
MSPAPSRDLGQAWHAYPTRGSAITELDSRVHVWRVRLDGLENHRVEALSEDERERAERLALPEDRRRFVAGRAVLRAILADALDLPPPQDGSPAGAGLVFGYAAAGKPYLVDDRQLRFNLSHSGAFCVIAVTRSGDVGIDVERLRPVGDPQGIARRAFTEAERAALLGCPPADREALFYRIWTRKEALLKAMGLGLPALGDPDAAALASGGAAWIVTLLPHLDGYAAALARPRGAHGLKLWSWPNAADMRGRERRARPRRLSGSPLPSPLRFEVCP